MKLSRFPNYIRIQATQEALQRVMIKERPQPETEKRIREIWKKAELEIAKKKMRIA